MLGGRFTRYIRKLYDQTEFTWDQLSPPFSPTNKQIRPLLISRGNHPASNI